MKPNSRNLTNLISKEERKLKMMYPFLRQNQIRAKAKEAADNWIRNPTQRNLKHTISKEINRQYKIFKGKCIQINHLEELSTSVYDLKSPGPINNMSLKEFRILKKRCSMVSGNITYTTSFDFIEQEQTKPKSLHIHRTEIVHQSSSSSSSSSSLQNCSSSFQDSIITENTVVNRNTHEHFEEANNTSKISNVLSRKEDCNNSINFLNGTNKIPYSMNHKIVKQINIAAAEDFSSPVSSSNQVVKYSYSNANKMSSILTKNVLESEGCSIKKSTNTLHKNIEDKVIPRLIHVNDGNDKDNLKTIQKQHNSADKPLRNERFTLSSVEKKLESKPVLSSQIDQRNFSTCLTNNNNPFSSLKVSSLLCNGELKNSNPFIKLLSNSIYLHSGVQEHTNKTYAAFLNKQQKDVNRNNLEGNIANKAFILQHSPLILEKVDSCVASKDNTRKNEIHTKNIIDKPDNILSHTDPVLLLNENTTKPSFSSNIKESAFMHYDNYFIPKTKAVTFTQNSKLNSASLDVKEMSQKTNVRHTPQLSKANIKNKRKETSKPSAKMLLAAILKATAKDLPENSKKEKDIGSSRIVHSDIRPRTEKHSIFYLFDDPLPMETDNKTAKQNRIIPSSSSPRNVRSIFDEDCFI